MEEQLRQLYQERASEADTLAILFVEKEASYSSATDRFDAVFLIIKQAFEQRWTVMHYELAGYSVAVHSLHEEVIQHSLLVGNQRRLVEWLVIGKIVFDRNEYVKALKRRMEEFPIEERREKMAIQFSKLLRHFEEGKMLFRREHYFDAFNCMMYALQHLARLAVTEHGYYPEVTIWEQVKQIEPETHKLYQELIHGSESIEKRVELLLIAAEYAIGSKVDVGSSHLIKIMESRLAPWSFQELLEREELAGYRIDLELLLNYLVGKNMIHITLEETKAQTIYHRLYAFSKKH
ncbi:nucleotidyltransferase-like protein [Halalkalibacterium ligniniphilum]|uniref:nucleotidyltransferase-like protein n=1 Tax=Halalkalibacterium ligniniphilum TaxID=1134413 RepID=UPI0003460B42|nr:nucleotidyltransferase-like protein [Halalkalibacterium ligniniphilum]